jgi:hypothetical protein
VSRLGTDILKFILDYWIYLLIVLGCLVFIIIVSTILNRQSRSVNTPPSDPTEPKAEEKIRDDSNNQPLVVSKVEPSIIEGNEPKIEIRTNSLPIIEKSGTIITSAIDPADQALPFDSDSLDLESLDSPRLESEANEQEPKQTENVIIEEPLKPAPKPKPKKNMGKYHVMYRDDGKWYVKREGSPNILRILETQREAVSWATIKALTQNVGIVVHKRDGKISKNNPI